MIEGHHTSIIQKYIYKKEDIKLCMQEEYDSVAPKCIAEENVSAMHTTRVWQCHSKCIYKRNG